MIKKINNNKWKVQVYGQDRFGNRIRKRKTVNGSKAAANRLELELKMELENLKSGFMFTGFTYQEFLEKEFFAHVDEHSTTEYQNLTLTMMKWCKPIMKLKLDAIIPNDIKEILAKAGESCSIATVRKLRSFINRSFIHAMNGGLKSNPVENVRVDKRRTKEFEPAVLTKEEIKILLAKAKIYKQTSWISSCRRITSIML